MEKRGAERSRKLKRHLLVDHLIQQGMGDVQPRDEDHGDLESLMPDG
jgi:hypothetical protein